MGLYRLLVIMLILRPPPLNGNTSPYAKNTISIYGGAISGGWLSEQIYLCHIWWLRSADQEIVGSCNNHHIWRIAFNLFIGVK